MDMRAVSYLRLLLVLPPVLLGSSGVNASDEGALATLHRYSTALTDNDCETMYALTSDAIKRREKAHEFRDLICQTVPKWHRAYMHETLAAPLAMLVDGKRRVLFVPARRESIEPPNRAISEFTYLVHSNDGGKTWRVLDLGCVDERWVKEIFPKYKGAPPIHAAQMRFEPL